MNVKDLENVGMDEANITQLLNAMLSTVKKGFLVSAIRNHIKELDSAINSNPSLYVCNGANQINWGYENKEECYKLSALLYERNAAVSTQNKISKLETDE